MQPIEQAILNLDGFCREINFLLDKVLIDIFLVF